MTRRKELRQEQRWDNTSDWATKNPILGPGEIGVEEETGFFKIGNGVDHWLDLDYYVTEEKILQTVTDMIAEIGSGAALIAHINSLTPHPVYDDGPSLELLYQNAKV